MESDERLTANDVHKLRPILVVSDHFVPDESETHHKQGLYIFFAEGYYIHTEMLNPLGEVEYPLLSEWKMTDDIFYFRHNNKFCHEGWVADKSYHSDKLIELLNDAAFERAVLG